MEEFLAIDIGGSSMKFARVSRGGTVRPLGRFPTGAHMTRAQLEEALTQAVSRAGGRPKGIGISSLGFVDTEAGYIRGGVENMPCLDGFSAAKLFAGICPGVPVSIINDASAAALGEQRFGAARGVHSFVCVAFGTGIGSCLVLNDKLWQGAGFRAGEIGYWDYDAPERDWEQESSAVALFRTAGSRLGVLDLTGEAFFARLSSGDPVCRELFERWTKKAGRIFANLVLLLDVSCILVGGGISAQGEALTQPLQRTMDLCLPPEFREHCRVIPAALGNDAALLGAVSLLC